MDKIEWVESLKVLEVKDGDVIVIKTKHATSREFRDHVTEVINDLFKGKNIKTLVLDDETDIGVLRAQPLLDSNEK